MKRLSLPSCIARCSGMWSCDQEEPVSHTKSSRKRKVSLEHAQTVTHSTPSGTANRGLKGKPSVMANRHSSTRRPSVAANRELKGTQSLTTKRHASATRHSQQTMYSSVNHALPRKPSVTAGYHARSNRHSQQTITQAQTVTNSKPCAQAQTVARARADPDSQHTVSHSKGVGCRV